jgi:predicted TIM-barrel fold metal-dependent hydrolase
MSDRLILVSGDGHAAASLESYRPYLESKYHAALDALIPEETEYRQLVAGPAHPTPEAMKTFDTRGAMAAGGEAGSYDIGIRLREMDAEGVACDILHSGTQSAPPLWYGAANRAYSAELQLAGVKAYHRWLVDFMNAADGRLAGVAEPGPTLDIPESVKNLHWLADNGFVSIGVPGQTYNADLPPLWDSYFEPFWTACEERGIVLSVHAGWGSPQGAVYKFFETMQERLGDAKEMGGDLDREKLEAVGAMLAQELAAADDSPFRLNLGPNRVIWQLMLGGVFDRHPNLKLVLTEVRATWVPATIAALEKAAAETRAPLKLSPSEYFEQNCAVAPSSPHRSEVEMRHEIGVHKMLFGTDYPHHEGTWPNTREWIKVAFEGVPEGEARRILGENAIELYGLDRAKLATIADRIGPWPAEVLVAKHDVPESLIEHFHTRSGFSRPADPVDVESIEQAFRSDLAAVGS